MDARLRLLVVISANSCWRGLRQTDDNWLRRGRVCGVSSEGLYDDWPVVSTESCPLSLTIQRRTSVERGCDTQKWIWPPLNCPPLALQRVTSITRLSLLMSRCWGTSPVCVCVWWNEHLSNIGWDFIVHKHLFLSGYSPEVLPRWLGEACVSSSFWA